MKGCRFLPRPVRNTYSWTTPTTNRRALKEPSMSSLLLLRDKSHQKELWTGLKMNDLQVISTDHCPFCFKEQKELGRNDFSKIPIGEPGRESHDLCIQRWGVAGKFPKPLRRTDLYQPSQDFAYFRERDNCHRLRCRFGNFLIQTRN